MKYPLLTSLLSACLPSPLPSEVLHPVGKMESEEVELTPLDQEETAANSLDTGPQVDLEITLLRENTAQDIWVQITGLEQELFCFKIEANKDFFIDQFHVADPYTSFAPSALYAFQLTWEEGEKFDEQVLKQDNYGRFRHMNWMMQKGDEMEVCVHGHLRSDLDYTQNFGAALMRIDGRGLESVRGLPLTGHAFTVNP